MANGDGAGESRAALILALLHRTSLLTYAATYFVFP
jgi:hypothetical protein